jgi:hypothetical protein
MSSRFEPMILLKDSLIFQELFNSCLFIELLTCILNEGALKISGKYL